MGGVDAVHPTVISRTVDFHLPPGGAGATAVDSVQQPVRRSTLPLKQRGFGGRIHASLQSESAFARILLLPALVVLALFMLYPFALGVWLSFTNAVVGHSGHWIGLKNFDDLLHDKIFRTTVRNTFTYTGVTIVFKLALGMGLALVMNQPFRFRQGFRAVLLLPFIVPTALSAIAWLMLFDSSLSPVTWAAQHLHLVKNRINWLGTPRLAMTSLIIANTWRGIPFFAISILAGLQTVPSDLYEAASIDGAGPVQRFIYVTLPAIRAVTLVVMLFSIITTFADFQLIYVLTKGGPFNSTQVFGTLTYQRGLSAANIGEGAAIALFMLPILAIISGSLLWYIRKED
jgi:multiple sugar transport system permease protein